MLKNQKDPRDLIIEIDITEPLEDEEPSDEKSSSNGLTSLLEIGLIVFFWAIIFLFFLGVF